MPAQNVVGPWWAVLTVWGIVNIVNMLQAAGFLSRLRTSSTAINHLLGYGMIALAVPATLVLVEFRSPKRYGILVPYLLLFFGSILLMGLPMFRQDRRLWLVTVATTVLLLASMGIAMRRGIS